MRSSRILLTVAVLFLCGGFAAADVGIGLTVGGDFPEVPEADEIYSRLLGESEITPGFLVYFKEYDWGMSFDFEFDFVGDSSLPSPLDPTWLDFRFATTYDWHPIPYFIVDPFLSLGAGFAMRAPLADEPDEPDEVHMSFHPVLGAGLNVRLGNLYLRGTLGYQGLSFVVPAPDIEPYDSGPYRVSLSAGILFD